MLNPKQKNTRKNTLLLLSVAHSCNDICWAMIPLLLPLIREELQFTYTQAGLILTCFSTVLLVFSLISGHLADLYENRKVLSFGFLFTAAAFPLLLPARSYVQIIVVLALAAIGVSVFHPVGTAYLSRGWRKGTSFGFFEAVGAGGILTMTVVFGPLVAALEWRLTALVMAIPSIPIGLTFLLSRVNLEHITADLPHSRENTSSHSPVGLKSIIVFYLARGLYIFGSIGVMSFLPLFAVDVRGLPPEGASLFPTFVWAGAVAGTLICGVLSDRVSSFSIIFALLILTLPAIFLLTLPLPFFIIAIFLIIFGFCRIGAIPAQTVWLSQVTSQKIRGKIFGGSISLVGLSQILSPLLFGFLADMWGLIATFRWAMLPLMGAAVLLGRLTYQLRKK